MIDPTLQRPAEVDLLLGDASKAREKLGWEPKVQFPELVRMMVQADLDRCQRRCCALVAAMTAAFWPGKRVVVTGGAGFLGAFVVEALVAAGLPAALRAALPRLRPAPTRRTSCACSTRPGPTWSSTWPPWSAASAPTARTPAASSTTT